MKRELDPLVEGIGARLREMREKRGLSVMRLAQRSGVAQGHLFQIESGKRPNPGADTLLALARGLAVSLDELFGYDASSAPSLEQGPRLERLEQQLHELARIVTEALTPARPGAPAPASNGATRPNGRRATAKRRVK